MKLGTGTRKTIYSVLGTRSENNNDKQKRKSEDDANNDDDEDEEDGYGSNEEEHPYYRGHGTWNKKGYNSGDTRINRANDNDTNVWGEKKDVNDSESEVSDETGASDNESGEAKMPARQGGPIGKKKVSRTWREEEEESESSENGRNDAMLPHNHKRVRTETQVLNARERRPRGNK